MVLVKSFIIYNKAYFLLIFFLIEDWPGDNYCANALHSYLILRKILQKNLFLSPFHPVRKIQVESHPISELVSGRADCRKWVSLTPDSQMSSIHILIFCINCLQIVSKQGLIYFCTLQLPQMHAHSQSYTRQMAGVKACIMLFQGQGFFPLFRRLHLDSPTTLPLSTFCQLAKLNRVLV